MHIVKRKGHRECFDERKVYASCYAACMSSHTPHKQAEKICQKVSSDVRNWIKSKRTVTAEQIFTEVGRRLDKHNKNAAFMYRTHRDIS